MRHSHSDITAVVAVAVLGVASTIVDLPSPMKIVLGIGVFAALGYAWSEVLLSHVTGLERVTAATGLALAAPVLGGLILYATGIPLRRTAWMGFLAGLTVVGAVVLIILRRTSKPPLLTRETRGIRLPVSHTLAFTAVVTIAAGSVVVARVGVGTQKYPGFTQLWLSPRSRDPLTANLGVTNQQGSRQQFRLVLLRRGHVSGAWNVTLADGQTWQHMITFSERYSIAANLYRLPDLAHPYRNVSNGVELGDHDEPACGQHVPQSDPGAEETLRRVLRRT